MEFQRKGNTIVLKTSTVTAEISSDEQGFIKVAGSLAFPVEKPGEYEFGSITFAALEQTGESGEYIAKPNVLNINELTYGAVVVMSKIELSKDTIQSIAHSNILITSVFDAKYIKQLQKALAIEKVVLVRTVGQNVDDAQISELKKQLEITDITETNKVKFTDKDLNSEEDKMADVYLLS